MYRIAKELDLTSIVGQFTTQLRVGQFDLQFTLGRVNFGISSPVNLFRDGKLFAHWEEGQWPEPGFYDVMNAAITRYDIPNDQLIILEFENGIAMHLVDDSDQYECMTIIFEGDPRNTWII